MAIDRAARAKRRRDLRAAERHADTRREVASSVLDVEGLFSSGAKHQREQLEWIAVAKEDEHEYGAGPLDLDSGVVRLRGDEHD